MELTQVNVNRPFHCGSQAADWNESNCARCVKAAPPDADYTGITCEIERAIGNAYMTDGTVSDDISRRMGYDGNHLAYVWPCGEFEATEAWKIEWRRRQTWRYRIGRWWNAKNSAFRKWRRERLEKRRMKIANREFDKYGGCWADWVMWAMSIDDRDKPGPDSHEKCREEGKPGSCYCGRFQSEVDDV